MKSALIESLSKTALNLGVATPMVEIEYPDNPEFGDFSTNIALMYSKSVNLSPRAFAEKIVTSLNTDLPAFVQSIHIAGPGFINIKIKDEAFTDAIVTSFTKDNHRLDTLQSEKRVLIEYTDPNIFKAFHIGHLMSNAIGESLSRLIAYSGAQVTRLCYPSDIGLHIAKSIWAMKRHIGEIPDESTSIQERTAFLGKMYVEGTRAYESGEMSGAGITAKDDIDALNKILYERSSPEVTMLYEKGRKWSLDHFETLYKRLGTHFDGYIYESEMAPVGLEIVKKFTQPEQQSKPVFMESDGAIVFKGEEYGLHTRVFINSHGLPTYEAKEMGLNITKFKQYPETDSSIVVTASEQNEYFKVITKALTCIDEHVGNSTKHIGHGMLRFASGKMSSRTGNVITAEALIDEIRQMVYDRIKDRDFSSEESEEVSDMIAIAAIKYTILRQSIGSDVIFDSAKSISFEGDSGPYLQYSVVRAQSILEKAKKDKIKLDQVTLPDKAGLLEKLLVRFPDIASRAAKELAPQQIASYLITLAGAFNSFYANTTIVDTTEQLSPYRVMLTQKFVHTMTEGLHILGIRIPHKM